MVRIWLFYKLSYEKLFIVCTSMPVNSVIKIERLTLCGPLSRAVNPPPHQILRIDRELMLDNVMMHETRRHLCAKTREKDVVGIVT